MVRAHGAVPGGPGFDSLLGHSLLLCSVDELLHSWLAGSNGLPGNADAVYVAVTRGRVAD